MSKQYLVIPLEEIENRIKNLQNIDFTLIGKEDNGDSRLHDYEISELLFIQSKGTILSISDDVEERAIKFCDKGIRAGYVSRKEGYIKGATDQQAISELKMVELLEWVESEHYWKSTDTRFPETLGLWTKTINGDFKVSEGKTTQQLIKLFNNHLKEVK